MLDKMTEMIMDIQAPLISKPIAKKIAEGLLKNGVIVPPCKVGDTVYFPCLDEDAEGFIDKGMVYAVSKCEDTVWFSVRYLSGLRYDHTANDYGRTVFLSREEAEAALKGADNE